VPTDVRTKDGDVTRLTEISLMEISVTSIPANSDTQLVGVRAMRGSLRPPIQIATFEV
jgi:phage head maturation protease